MADAYQKLSVFLETFHECVEPSVSTVDENTSAMLIYQANMANSMKTIMELMKGQAAEQNKGTFPDCAAICESDERNDGF